MNGKKILIIIATLGGGGAERVATTIGSELNKDNEIIYLTWYNRENEYDYSGVKICTKDKESVNGYIAHIYRTIKRLFLIKRISKKYKIDYCISFMEDSNFPNILSKIILHNKSKIIVSIRVSVDAYGIIGKSFIRLFYNKADLIIPNSQEEKENLINNYGIKSNKIITIYNPLELEKIKVLNNENIEENIIFHKKFTFVSVGRLVEEKNQKFLIKCFQRFSSEYPNTQLLVIGDGPLRDDLIQLSKNKNIVFLGYQKNVYKYLSKSDCFLFSSLYEGFPNAILEAMACGLPIISTKFKTGIQEIIGDNQYGILVEKGDEDGFVNAMKSIYLDKEKHKFYKNKSLLRAKDFEFNKIIKQRKTILR